MDLLLIFLAGGLSLFSFCTIPLLPIFFTKSQSATPWEWAILVSGCLLGFAIFLFLILNMRLLPQHFAWFFAPLTIALGIYQITHSCKAKICHIQLTRKTSFFVLGLVASGFATPCFTPVLSMIVATMSKDYSSAFFFCLAYMSGRVITMICIAKLPINRLLLKWNSTLGVVSGSLTILLGLYLFKFALGY